MSHRVTQGKTIGWRNELFPQKRLTLFDSVLIAFAATVVNPSFGLPCVAAWKWLRCVPCGKLALNAFTGNANPLLNVFLRVPSRPLRLIYYDPGVPNNLIVIPAHLT